MTNGNTYFLGKFPPCSQALLCDDCAHTWYVLLSRVDQSTKGEKNARLFVGVVFGPATMDIRARDVLELILVK